MCVLVWACVTLSLSGAAVITTAPPCECNLYQQVFFNDNKQILYHLCVLAVSVCVCACVCARACMYVRKRDILKRWSNGIRSPS